MNHAKSYGYIWLSPEMYQADQRMLNAKQASVLQFCHEHALTLSEFHFETALTADLFKRPVLAQILAEMGPEDLLIVESLTDLGRRFYDVYSLMQYFHEGKGHFVSIQEALHTHSPQGRTFIEILQKIPQLQGTGQTVKPENLHRSTQSRSNGGACPYGYRIDPESNNFALLPEEAAVVCRIFHDKGRGQSLRQIAMRMTRDGIATKRGGKWHANTIKTILENIFYTGNYLTHCQIEAEHHPAIIDLDLFLKVNGHETLDDFIYR